MGYFIRVLSKCDARMPLGELRARLAASAPTASLVVEGGDEKNWGQLLVKVGATDICEVCCDVDGGPESLVRAEAAEFVDEIQEEQPASAVRWLERYLPSVKSIYALRILHGGSGEVDWEVVGALKDAIHDWATGIVQADGEGFSNESGYHILWQFSPDATGEWHMAVLDDAGRWQQFAMELGNTSHRDAFHQGTVPDGVKSTQSDN